MVPSRFESSWNFSRFCCQRLAGDKARQLYSGRAIFLSDFTLADSMCRQIWLRDVELTTQHNTKVKAPINSFDDGGI
jgi:hypothetical protein